MINRPSSSQEMLRLFLAFAIPESIRARLKQRQQELRPLLPSPAVRWTKPEQFHLTLKFLGNVPVSEFPALKETVRALCTSLPPLSLRAQGLGFFPNHSSPRVFWVGIKSDNDLLLEFQRKLDASTRPFSEKHEDQKFTPHVTLARFEKLPRGTTERFSEHIIANENFGDWTAREVKLIQSTLSPTGATHAILEAFGTRNE
jgi:2'-5' RNA ligase